MIQWTRRRSSPGKGFQRHREVIPLGNTWMYGFLRIVADFQRDWVIGEAVDATKFRTVGSIHRCGLTERGPLLLARLSVLHAVEKTTTDEWQTSLCEAHKRKVKFPRTDQNFAKKIIYIGAIWVNFFAINRSLLLARFSVLNTVKKKELQTNDNCFSTKRTEENWNFLGLITIWKKKKRIIFGQ